MHRVWDPSNQLIVGGQILGLIDNNPICVWSWHLLILCLNYFNLIETFCKQVQQNILTPLSNAIDVNTGIYSSMNQLT